MRAALVVGLALVGFGVGTARACGHCVEDKVAATYDYTVVTRAHAAGHRVYVFELVGGIRPGDEAVRRAVAAAVAAAPGVDKGSVRVALSPAAASCAADPAAFPERRLPHAVRTTLHPRGLSLRWIATVDR